MHQKEMNLQQQQDQGICPILGEMCKHNAEQVSARVDYEKKYMTIQLNCYSNSRTCHGLSRN